MPDLQPNGNPVRLGRTTLRTPGLAGSVSVHAAGSPGMRAAEHATAALDDALAAEHLQAFETLEIAGAREVPVGAGVTRSTSLGEPAIELTVPDPGADWGQVVLAVDESGVATWSFARDERGAVDVTRGGETRTYLVPRHTPPPAHPAETRGLIGAAGRKLLKVLVFPLVDPIVGEVGERLAARWESQRRPYQLRSFTPAGYQSAEAEPLRAEDWQRLASGRALLLLHGTFSRAHANFAGLPPAFVEWLHDRYEGRVFAFDHFTLSEDPRQNAEWLLRSIPSEVGLDLDILCHSRGGLISRVLAEQGDALPETAQRIRIDRVVFLGTPNAGTILADTKYLGDLVDTMTNVLNFLPPNGVTDILVAVITVVKQLAVGALSGLEGLSSMVPRGEFLETLNASAPTIARYFAVAADFEPPAEGGLGIYARNMLHDRIFGAANDLIVPTASAWEVEGGASFPITARHVFSAADAVTHNDLVHHPVALDRIREWLA